MFVPQYFEMGIFQHFLVPFLWGTPSIEKKPGWMNEFSGATHEFIC